jgi:hypothetical protein
MSILKNFQGLCPVLWTQNPTNGLLLDEPMASLLLHHQCREYFGKMTVYSTGKGRLGIFQGRALVHVNAHPKSLFLFWVYGAAWIAYT